jgi:hypothetical protein
LVASPIIRAVRRYRRPVGRSRSAAQRVCGQAVRSFVALVLAVGFAPVHASLRAQAPNPQETTDLEFHAAISRIVSSAERDFADIAGVKISNEYKTAIRIAYHGSRYGGLIAPAAGGGWSCTFPVLLTLDKKEADAAFAEWTSALTSTFTSGRLLPVNAGSESSGAAHSNLERVAADAPVSIWGAERGATQVRLFYTMNHDDQSYYLEVAFVHRPPARR